MSIKIGIPKETYPGERRVSMNPASGAMLVQKGFHLIVESRAGENAGFLDEDYRKKGILVGSRQDVFAADLILQVRTFGANPGSGRYDLDLFREGQVVVGFMEPLSSKEEINSLARKGVTSFALELLPRITRAQEMDVLSSQATISGYRAVMLAATHLPKMFPMLVTSAGTLTPARVFVIGAGVAGLQAIATSRRLGGVVQAYDVRPAVKEQINSLGAKFVELPLHSEGSETSGGYAKVMDESFYNRQRDLMAKVISQSDVVISTAVIPGKKAPVLITGEMVRGMPNGSVIVDIAAEKGGNCEITKAGETIVEGGVQILGPLNLPSDIPNHASQMYAKNLASFVINMWKNDSLQIESDDEIIKETLVTHKGEVVNKRVKEVLGL